MRVNICGGGVFGLSAALELSARGHRVQVFERGPTPNPGAASAGLCRAVRPDYGGDVELATLALRAMEGWHMWNEAAGQRLFRGDGFLSLSDRGPNLEEGLRVLRGLELKVESLDAESLERRFPAWSGAALPHGYFHRAAGWVQANRSVLWLREQAYAKGIRILPYAVEALFPGGLRAGGRAWFGGVVVAAGAWTPKLLPELSSAFQAVENPVVHLDVEQLLGFGASGFPPFSAVLDGVTWQGFPTMREGVMQLALHSEGERVGPDRPPRWRPEHELALRRFLELALPGLAHAPITHRYHGVQCVSQDGDFLIDSVPGRAEVWVASGGSGHAFKFAPILGDLVADALEGRPHPRFAWRRMTPPLSDQIA